VDARRNFLSSCSKEARMEPGQIAWYIQHFVNILLPYAAAAVGITMISFTPLGRAAISWLKGHINRGRAAELAGEIDRLRQELMETQERLDFAERNLLRSGGPAPRPTPDLPTPV
jgi:hypothetical protein